MLLEARAVTPMMTARSLSLTGARSQVQGLGDAPLLYSTSALLSWACYLTKYDTYCFLNKLVFWWRRVILHRRIVARNFRN